jgi:nucleotide-binding universal stress UspA family protein
MKLLRSGSRTGRRRTKDWRIRTILVPIDFSTQSIRAIKTAQFFTRQFGAAIHLVHIFEIVYPTDFVGASTALSLTPAAVFVEERRLLERRLKRIGSEHAVPAPRCHLLHGLSIHEEICRLAQQIQADLIVMPTHGRTGLTRLMLGSTAERVVQHSPCPVLIAKKPSVRQRGSAFGIKKILVPVDFSRCSREGLKYAIRFAKKCSARIHLLNATFVDYAYTSLDYPIDPIARLQELIRTRAEQTMKDFVRRVRFGDVKFDTTVEVGRTIDHICAFAEREEVDLIIVSTHGRTGLAHALLGSVAERVIRRATRPTLVVPSHIEIQGKRLIALSGSRPTSQTNRYPFKLR